jgi:hypothetical protein
MWQPGDAFEYRAMAVADLGWIALHEGDAQQTAVQFGESLRLFWDLRDQAGMNARALAGRVQPCHGSALAAGKCQPGCASDCSSNRVCR